MSVFPVILHDEDQFAKLWYEDAKDFVRHRHADATIVMLIDEAGEVTYIVRESSDPKSDALCRPQIYDWLAWAMSQNNLEWEML